MQPRIYSPALQGRGEFDGGRILEQKPIGFPGEGSVVKRVGPLFYWAWATTSGSDGEIGLHPHKGFEILTYVTEGRAHHGDTLGTRSAVGPGSVQVMQTGSGVSHEERVEPGSEMFQIWFEPELSEAFRRTPTYNQYEHEAFPSETRQDHVSLKTVIGPGSPIELVADASMWDAEITSGARYVHRVPEGYTLTALAIRGHGAWGIRGEDRPPAAFAHRDFILGVADAETEVEITNTGEEPLRLLLIQVPTVVHYPLYPKR